MTISEEQRETYQSTVSEFTRQSEENTCLAIVLKNVVDELAERQDLPDMAIEKEEVLDMVDYDPFYGCTSDFLPERLNPHLQDFNYEVKEDRALSLDDLEELIHDQATSYPIVELDERYLGWVNEVDGFHADVGSYGRTEPHTVIPFAFNDETVMIFDPFESFYLPSPGESAPPKQVPQPLFYEWWSGESTPRWTLWIEPPSQQTLGQIQDSDQ